MTARKIRWGILGVAKINDRLIPAWAKTTHSHLLGIASRDLDKAKGAAAKSGIERAYGSYEELLADPDIDAVYIPLPNHLHAEWVGRAAEAGKHVLCEKPLTPTAPAAGEVVDYCAARGVKLMDGFMWPHHPRTAKLRKALDQGVIGKILRVTAAFTFNLPLDPKNIRLQPQAAGGSLLDVGCYTVYGIRWAMGVEPVSVIARARYEYGVDLEMSCVMAFADGRLASFDCGFTAPMRQWLEITGETGVVRVEDMWVPDEKAAYTVYREGKAPERVETPGFDQIACMIDDFSRAVIDDGEIVPHPSQAVLTQRVLDALAMAAAEEREVDV